MAAIAIRMSVVPFVVHFTIVASKYIHYEIFIAVYFQGWYSPSIRGVSPALARPNCTLGTEKRKWEDSNRLSLSTGRKAPSRVPSR